MHNYLGEIMKSQIPCDFNDTRVIITDRMGTWKNQNVTLVWEGYWKGKTVSLTPDEVEVLFPLGLANNIARGEDGKLYEKSTFLDCRSFDGAIVCGILAPYAKKSIRKEILAYAKKMGYISDKMQPVQMTCGTKSLVANTDGTYTILYKWNESVLKKIDAYLLKLFTSNHFNSPELRIKPDGIVMENLLEEEVFSMQNIDLFREYDIKLKYLDPDIDKTLLLKAVMLRAHIDIPENYLRERYFLKKGNVKIPFNTKNGVTFNEFGKCNMKCGTLYHKEGAYDYTYAITIPYKETVREVMVCAERIFEHLKNKWKDLVYVRFNPFCENINICFRHEHIKREIEIEVEREFVTLDTALDLLNEEKSFNIYQFYESIISLLESDSSGFFKDEYFTNLEMMKKVLSDKWGF